VLAAALFPTAIAVMGVGFGALMRHTASAIGILFAILFVAPLLFETLGGVWGRASEYLPGEAGQAMITVVRESGDMSPATGLLVLIGWIGALFAIRHLETVIVRRIRQHGTDGGEAHHRPI
jgi:hypothetical protein